MTQLTPYPGLRPFGRDESHLFFGRDEQVDQLLDKLAESHFLAVLGTSGSGKSSLVRAGLLPALESGHLAGAGACWQVAELRPGDHPFERLATALGHETAWGQAAAPDPAALEADLRRGPRALNWQLGVHPLAAGQRLLILVDQFEELFRFQHQGRAEAEAFVALLLGAASHPECYIVITMRFEFLGDCADYPDLPETINAGLFLASALSPEQMADAIQLPARLAPFNGEVEPALVRRLLAEARGRMDQLPLLQHALMRLWDLDPGGKMLTLEAFETLGGLEQTLNRHLEQVWQGLDKEQRRIAERMFRSLTERGSGGRDTRRPVPLAEVAALAGVAPDDVAAVVELFRQPGRSFLMPPLGVALAPETTLDITHEALIRQWRRLRRWTGDEAEQADLYHRLEGAAQRHRVGKGALWIDPDLHLALQWREEHHPDPRWAQRYGGDFELAMAFLEESRAAREAGRQAEERRRQGQVRLARWIALAAVVALVVTLGLAGWAVKERDRADEERNNVQRERDHAQQVEQVRTESLFDASLTHASLLARVGDPAEALAVLRSTVALDPAIPETRRHARNLMAGHAEILSGAAEQVYTGAGAALIDVAVSPDGTLLAAAGERGTLVLFAARGGQILKRLVGHDPQAGKVGSVNAVLFSPDGGLLYSAGDDGRIRRWSMPAGEPVGEGWQVSAGVWAMALTPDGNTLASAGQGDGITLWATATGKIRRTLRGKSSRIADGNSLAFTPDGRHLVSGSYQGEVGLWSLAKGSEEVLPRRHSDEVNAVAVSPDGHWLATGGSDKGIVLWDLAQRRPLSLLAGHGNIVFGLRFVPEGRLLSASRDITLRLWDLVTGTPLRIYQGHSAGLWSVVRHQERLFTASEDGTLRRWSLATPGQWLWELEPEPISAAVEPGGAFVTVGMADGALRLYALPTEDGTSQAEVHGPTEPRVAGDGGQGAARPNPLAKPIAEFPAAHKMDVSRLAYSPDGRFLATASDDHTAKIWRIDRTPSGPTLTLLHTLEGHDASVHAVAFSPDGRTLATAGCDGKVGLFEVASGERQRLFSSAVVGQTLTVEFDPAANRLLTVNEDDQTVRLWDLGGKLQAPVEELPKFEDMPLWATLRPDGRQLAVVGRDLGVTLHDLSPNPGPPRRLVGHERSVFRAIYSPDGRQLATVSSDMTLRLWDLSRNQVLFSQRLPAARFRGESPLWDFDFRCMPAAATTPDAGHCWLAVPLTMGRLALYRLPYDQPPASMTAPAPPGAGLVPADHTP